MSLKIDLGCGPHPLDGYIGIDKNPSADVVLDLENAILPYDDGTVDMIHASHIFEHIKNLIPLVNECWRILKPGGTINISTPHVPHLEAFGDPTHVRFFTTDSWRYWLKGDFYYEDFGKHYDILPFSSLAQGTQGFQLLAQLTK